MFYKLNIIIKLRWVASKNWKILNEAWEYDTFAFSKLGTT